MSSEIYICGDLHGNFFESQFNNFPEFKEEDYLIVCGDFGFLKRNKQKNLELRALDNLTSKVNGATVLFIDGNHENFERLKNLKSEYLFDNEVGKVNDRIFHLKRGRPYHINGKSIFTFGGATSIDRMYRNQGIDWWAEEVPSKDEVELGLNVACSEKFDYIITHTCPISVRTKIQNKKTFNLYCYAEASLEKIYHCLDGNFDKWYFGHFHTDENIGDKYRLVYRDILKIGE